MTPAEVMADHAALHKTPCDLDVGADWPYHCPARDEHPDHVVIVCRRHLVWTHVDPAALDELETPQDAWEALRDQLTRRAEARQAGTHDPIG